MVKSMIEQLHQANQGLANLIKPQLVTASTRDQCGYVLLILAGKGCKTHEAILLLAQGGYGQDAGILLRSLFNLVINVMWMGIEPETRVKMFVDYDWMLRDQAGVRVAYGIEHLGLESSLTGEQRTELDHEISAEVARVIEEHDFGKSGWAKRDLYSMARDVGLEKDYDFMYRPLSDLEHSNSRSLIYYQKLGPLGTMVDLQRNGLGIGPILGSAYMELLLLGKLANRVLDLNLTHELAEAEARLPIIKAMAIELDDGGAS
jgi:hypothetical protein